MDPEITSRLEELGLSQDQIDDILPLLVDEKTAHPETGASSSSIESLRSLMMTETDYKKRAAMAARIISMQLEEGY